MALVIVAKVKKIVIALIVTHRASLWPVTVMFEVTLSNSLFEPLSVRKRTLRSVSRHSSVDWVTLEVANVAKIWSRVVVSASNLIRIAIASVAVFFGFVIPSASILSFIFRIFTLSSLSSFFLFILALLIGFSVRRDWNGTLLVRILAHVSTCLLLVFVDIVFIICRCAGWQILIIRIILLAWLDRALIGIVLSSWRVLALVDKFAVRITVPSPFRAFELVDSSSREPVSRAFQCTLSIVNITSALIRSINRGQVGTLDELLAVAARAVVPKSGLGIAGRSSAADELPAGMASEAALLDVAVVRIAEVRSSVLAFFFTFSAFATLLVLGEFKSASPVASFGWWHGALSSGLTVTWLTHIGPLVLVAWIRLVIASLVCFFVRLLLIA